jgi:hypothetical protein
MVQFDKPHPMRSTLQYFESKEDSLTWPCLSEIRRLPLDSSEHERQTALPGSVFRVSGVSVNRRRQPSHT